MTRLISDLSQWKEHLKLIIWVTIAFQVVFGVLISLFPWILPQMIILTCSTNIIAVGYIAFTLKYMDSIKKKYASGGD